MRVEMDARLTTEITRNVAAALAEDIGAGDITGELIPADRIATASVTTRDAMTLAGRPWFDEACRQVDAAIEVTWQYKDGDRVAEGTVLCELRGPARSILTAERSALNFLQLLSATATVTRQYADAIAGTGCRVLDTRKTIPGLRLAQKYAVRCGGGSNHRFGLDDSVIIKDNHIALAGGVRPAVERVRAAIGHTVKVELEVDTLAQLEEGLEVGVDVVMLDNMTAEELRSAVELVDGRTVVEASGGITLANAAEVAATGVDLMAVGALTHSAKSVDLSMEVIT